MPRGPKGAVSEGRTVIKRGRGARSEDGQPNPIDIHVGKRIRLRRTLLGMSQEKLGELLGLTFQQVQKYERGANRVGASRLFDLSRVLDVPVSFFFDDLAPELQGQLLQPARVTQQVTIQGEDDPMARRETQELVQAYYNIPDEHVRRGVFALAKAMADAQEGGEDIVS